MIEPYACAGMQNLHVNAEFAEQAHRTPPAGRSPAERPPACPSELVCLPSFPSSGHSGRHLLHAGDRSLSRRLPRRQR